MNDFSTPKFSSSTFITGVIQLVVQEAFEIIFSPAYLSALTPKIYIGVSSFPGAERITFFAPASMCALAFSLVKKIPVDSMTTSIPNSVQGNFSGSFSDKKRIRWLFINISPSS